MNRVPVHSESRNTVEHALHFFLPYAVRYMPEISDHRYRVSRMLADNIPLNRVRNQIPHLLNRFPVCNALEYIQVKVVRANFTPIMKKVHVLHSIDLSFESPCLRSCLLSPYSWLHSLANASVIDAKL